MLLNKANKTVNNGYFWSIDCMKDHYTYGINGTIIARVAYGEEPPVTPEPPVAPPTPPVAPVMPAGVKLLTQDEVNKIVSDRTAEYLNKANKAQTLLSQLQIENVKTAEERKNFQIKVEELQSTLMTKEQAAAFEAAKIKKEAEESANALQKDRDYWKNSYTQEKITSALINAAITHKAYDPDQIVVQLGSSAKLQEVIDEAGQPTGKLEVKVAWSDFDKEGKPVNLLLSPADTVKAMRQKDKFANLFLAEGGGTGYVPTGGKPDTGSLDPDKMSPAEYMAGGRDRLMKSKQ